MKKKKIKTIKMKQVAEVKTEVQLVKDAFGQCIGQNAFGRTRKKKIKV